MLECEGSGIWDAVQQGARMMVEGQGNSQLAGIYAGNPLAMSISSSQFMSCGVAAAGWVHCRVTRVLVEIGEVGDGGRVVGLGFWRRAHSNSWRGSRMVLGGGL